MGCLMYPSVISGTLFFIVNIKIPVLDRRTAIKQFLVISGGVIFAPSCTFSSKRVSIALDTLNITPEQEELLAGIAETFIPETDLPGAKSLKLHHFVLVMMDDCRDQSDQKMFEQGLADVAIAANREYGKYFVECDPSQQQALVSDLMEGEESEARSFLRMTKQYTVQGFLQSKYFMTEIEPYRLVPGDFDGCVSL